MQREEDEVHYRFGDFLDDNDGAISGIVKDTVGNPQTPREEDEVHYSFGVTCSAVFVVSR